MLSGRGKIFTINVKIHPVLLGAYILQMAAPSAFRNLIRPDLSYQYDWVAFVKMTAPIFVSGLIQKDVPVKPKWRMSWT